MASPTRIFVDRSRVEEFQHCPRRRYLAYHQDGRGIVPAKKALPLAVGGAVHRGLEVLLTAGAHLYTNEQPHVRDGQEVHVEYMPGTWRKVEDAAVTAALADFSAYAGALEVDATEAAALHSKLKAFDVYDVADATIAAEMTRDLVVKHQRDFDDYLYQEQSALVEALVRAYARRRLRPLLVEYEVLEVEREGQWQLHAPHGINEHSIAYWGDPDLWFMSRPDALLRDRTSNQLYLQSFKTTASWDVRKERDAQHDMQGLSEGVEVERRLAEWWESIQVAKADGCGIRIDGCSQATNDYLRDLPAPPRILGIRYEYLLKGDRRRDRDLSARLGVEARSQASHLVRGYYNASGDGSWNWSWDYLKPDAPGEASKLYGGKWKGTPVWESMPVARWIDMLDGAAMTVGEEGVELGYGCDAQATGYTARHPLDEVFIPPMVVYRGEDDLRDWCESTEAQEVRVAEATARIAAAADEGERRHLLNVLMPMSRRACSYPTECPYTRVCYGGEDIRRDPLGSGLYKARVPNHPQENSAPAPISLDRE